MSLRKNKSKTPPRDDGNRIAHFIACREIPRPVIDALCDRREILEAFFSLDPEKVHLINPEKLKAILNPIE